ncbi:Ubiquitin carboxyl-terminal hydrolase 16 [Trametes pubescens]|uniref:ubiquitinyl hydrolase 1 n=1 Tax=Trametes pubescens TaxID=154538 RepID=A0A1M2VPJ2_TRAPU|nr:Ubiquitin carboxyl-terminal hydrolase 16 [Trametes pubescens]
MLLHGDLEHYAYLVLSNPAFQQIAPIVVLIFVPTLFLFAHSYRHSIAFAGTMVFDSLASLLPWNWSDASSSLSNSERKRLKRRHVRNSTRDDQVVRTSSQDTASESSSEDGYYPGLVNISGTYCFMNSTLQAMASLTYLQPRLDEIHARAESLDVPTPVIDALRELVRVLNTPSSSSRPHRPIDIITALSGSNPSKNNSLFSSREHQDAQELFQLLSECIKNEALAVANEIRRDRGLSVALTKQDDLAARNISKTVFDGLTANRRSCMECGYTEAVMHFPFDNWQLALPGMVGACRLEACLEDYTRLELLSDCICRKCSMLATYRRLEQEAERLTEAAQASNNPSSSKKKRARDTRKLMSRVKAAIDEGRIEEDIAGVKTEKVFSRASTKQSMVARPPPVLALHLNRSIHYGHHATKNNTRVIFPEILDLTPFTTSGQLSTQPSAPISSPPPPIPTQRSVTPTPSTYAVPRTLYRLSAVVCHYGQHSFGHYVCFRRKPRPPSAGERRFAPPKLACPLGCDCARCERYGPVRDSRDASGTHPGRGWLRISDDAVQECGLERVLQEGSGAFMLYYERVLQPRASPYTGSPRGSEETVKVKAEEAHAKPPSRAPTPAPVPTANGRPELVRRESSSRPNGNGDVARRRESRERREDDRGKVIDPRVVRRTSAHRRPSAPPMSRTESSSTTATTNSKHSHHPSAPNGEPAIAPSSSTLAPNGRPHHHRSHSHSRPHTPPNGGAAPQISPQRPPLSPTPSSKSGRLRKSRRSISQTQSDAHTTVSSGQAVPPTSLRA